MSNSHQKIPATVGIPVEEKPKKDVITKKNGEPAKKKIKIIRKDDELSTLKNCDEKDSTPLSVFKKLFDSMAGLKEENRQLNEKISKISEEINNKQPDKENIQRLEETVFEMKIQLESAVRVIHELDEKKKLDEMEYEKNIKSLENIIKQLINDQRSNSQQSDHSYISPTSIFNKLIDDVIILKKKVAERDVTIDLLIKAGPMKQKKIKKMNEDEERVLGQLVNRMNQFTEKFTNLESNQSNLKNFCEGIIRDLTERNANTGMDQRIELAENSNQQIRKQTNFMEKVNEENRQNLGPDISPTSILNELIKEVSILKTKVAERDVKIDFLISENPMKQQKIETIHQDEMRVLSQLISRMNQFTEKFTNLESNQSNLKNFCDGIIRDLMEKIANSEMDQRIKSAENEIQKLNESKRDIDLLPSMILEFLKKQIQNNDESRVLFNKIEKSFPSKKKQ